MGRKPKTQRKVVAPRLEEWVAAELAAMRPTGEIVDLAITEFGCCERTVYEAIGKARERWMAASTAGLEERRGFFLARLDLAWRRATEDRDWRGVASIARAYMDVAGLRAPSKLEHSGEIGVRPVAAMSPEERRAEIALLQAKMLAAGGIPRDQQAVAAVVASSGAIAVEEEEEHEDDDESELDDPN